MLLDRDVSMQRASGPKSESRFRLMPVSPCQASSYPRTRYVLPSCPKSHAAHSETRPLCQSMMTAGMPRPSSPHPHPLVFVGLNIQPIGFYRLWKVAGETGSYSRYMPVRQISITGEAYHKWGSLYVCVWARQRERERAPTALSVTPRCVFFLPHLMWPLDNVSQSAWEDSHGLWIAREHWASLSSEQPHTYRMWQLQGIWLGKALFSAAGIHLCNSYWAKSVWRAAVHKQKNKMRGRGKSKRITLTLFFGM